MQLRAGIVRHALTYLLHGRDPLPVKAAACLEVPGAYHVAGLGPSFWSAVLQALAPSRHPSWTPDTLTGLERSRLERSIASGNERRFRRHGAFVSIAFSPS